MNIYKEIENQDKETEINIEVDPLPQDKGEQLQNTNSYL